MSSLPPPATAFPSKRAFELCDLDSGLVGFDEVLAYRATFSLKDPLKVNQILLLDKMIASRPPTQPLPSHHRQPFLPLLNRPRDSLWSLRLISPIQSGPNQWSQVWKCQATDGIDSVEVVVKLYYESLFPSLKQCWSTISPDWQGAYLTARGDAYAFDGLASKQGLTAPLCYGFYVFKFDDREEVIGVVMEDLSSFKTLSDILVDRPVPPNISDALISALFDTCHSYLEASLLNFHLIRSSIRVVPPVSPSNPHLMILTTFFRTLPHSIGVRSRDIFMEQYEELSAVIYASLDVLGCRDRDPMYQWMKTNRGGVEWEWYKNIHVIGRQKWRAYSAEKIEQNGSSATIAAKERTGVEVARGEEGEKVEIEEGAYFPPTNYPVLYEINVSQIEL